MNFGWIGARSEHGFTPTRMYTSEAYNTPRAAAVATLKDLSLNGVHHVSEVWVGRLVGQGLPGDGGSGTQTALFSVVEIRRIEVSPVSGVSSTVTE